MLGSPEAATATCLRPRMRWSLLLLAVLNDLVAEQYEMRCYSTVLPPQERFNAVRNRWVETRVRVRVGDPNSPWGSR
jgi:hypothetical protein